MDCSRGERFEQEEQERSDRFVIFRGQTKIFVFLRKNKFLQKKMFTQKMFTPNFDLNSLLPNSRVKFPR